MPTVACLAWSSVSADRALEESGVSGGKNENRHTRKVHLNEEGKNGNGTLRRRTRLDFFDVGDDGVVARSPSWLRTDDVFDLSLAFAVNGPHGNLIFSRFGRMPADSSK